MRPGARRAPGRGDCAVRGQAAVDYLLVVALIALAMALGADAPVGALLAAVADRYGAFTWAVSLP